MGDAVIYNIEYHLQLNLPSFVVKYLPVSVIIPPWPHDPSKTKAVKNLLWEHTALYKTIMFHVFWGLKVVLFPNKWTNCSFHSSIHLIIWTLWKDHVFISMTHSKKNTGSRGKLWQTYRHAMNVFVSGITDSPSSLWDTFQQDINHGKIKDQEIRPY